MARPLAASMEAHQPTLSKDAHNHQKEAHKDPQSKTSRDPTTRPLWPTSPARRMPSQAVLTKLAPSPSRSPHPDLPALEAREASHCTTMDPLYVGVMAAGELGWSGHGDIVVMLWLGEISSGGVVPRWDGGSADGDGGDACVEARRASCPRVLRGYGLRSDGIPLVAK